VTASSRPDHDGPEPGGEAALTLVLELSLTEADPITGSIGVEGGAPPVLFHGWIDLMSAINSLRADAAPRTHLPGLPGLRVP
jgi:hypothetical protein